MTSAPLSLNIDTATGACSVALTSGDKLLAEIKENDITQQARILLPMIEAVLLKATVTYQDLSAISVTIGPGSFTGVRVGLAAARSIGFATGLAVHGVSTLSCMAYDALAEVNAHADIKILSLVNAGKKEVYYQLFTPSPTFCALDEPAICSADALHDLLQVNNCIVVGYKTLLTQNSDTPILSHITSPDAAAAGKLCDLYPSFRLSPQPLYIRPPDAKLPQHVASIRE